MFKRNITFGLASPKDHNDGAAWVSAGGPASSWTLKDQTFPPGTDGSDLTAIACAVNIFGQDKIFGYQFNGLCFNGNSLKSGRGTCFPPFTLSLLRKIILKTSFANLNAQFFSLGWFFL